MSHVDLDPGARWSERIGTELEASGFGVLCVTPENASAPWLLFEAGALSKAVGSSRVCPFLVGMRPTDVTGPLAQFQAIECERSQVLRLLGSINGELPEGRLGDPQLTETFDLWWPRLEALLRAAASADVDGTTGSSRRLVEDMVSEILELVRESRRSESARSAADAALPSEGEERPANGRFGVGQKVNHLQFGKGVVLGLDTRGKDEILTVRFARVGTKRLVARVARLAALADSES